MATAPKKTAPKKTAPAPAEAEEQSVDTKVTIEQLVAVATEFNSFMFNEGEGIDLELEYDELLAEIQDSAGDLVAEDHLSQGTIDILGFLDIDHAATVAEEEKAPEVDKSAINTVKKAKTVEDIKAIAKEHRIACPPPFLKDIDKLRPYVIGKLENPGPQKSRKEKNEKKKSERKPFVMDALREITCKNEDITIEELTSKIEGLGYTVTQRTVFSVLNDTQKIIAQLKANGRLKK